MSLFEKLKHQAGTAAQTAGVVAQAAVQQTKNLAAIGRVKLSIASEEDKLKKAYTELGRLFFRDHEAQTALSTEDYQPWCDRAANAKAQISRLRQELNRIRMETPVEDLADAKIAIEMDSCSSENSPTQESEPAPQTVENNTQEAEEPKAQAPIINTAAPSAEPTIGTLYVDITNTED